MFQSVGGGTSLQIGAKRSAGALNAIGKPQRGLAGQAVESAHHCFFECPDNDSIDQPQCDEDGIEDEHEDRAILALCPCESWAFDPIPTAFLRYSCVL